MAVVWAAVLFVSLVFLVTNRTPPDFDAVHYVSMSTQVRGESHSMAPFAYRIAIPEALGLVQRLTGAPIEAVYRLAAYLASLGLVIVMASIARQFLDDTRKVVLIALIGASGFWHVKYAAHFDTMIDIHAVLLVSIGWYLILRGHLFLAGLLGAVGLIAKEWLGVIVAVSAYSLLRRQRQGDRAALLWAVGVVALAVFAIVVVRIQTDVTLSVQKVDPLNDPDWWREVQRLVLDPKRLFNVVLAILGYWLPVLILIFCQDFRAVGRTLSARGLTEPVALHLFLVTILTLLGGTNIGMFTSYAAPVLVTILALQVHAGVSVRELALLLLIVAVYNRLFFGVPDHRDGIEAFIDHIPPYNQVVNSATWWRLAELIALLIGGGAALSVLAQKRPRQIS